MKNLELNQMVLVKGDGCNAFWYGLGMAAGGIALSYVTFGAAAGLVVTGWGIMAGNVQSCNQE